MTVPPIHRHPLPDVLLLCLQLEEYGLLYQVNSWGPLLRLMQADAHEKKAKWQGEQVGSDTAIEFNSPFPPDTKRGPTYCM